ncbi:MAG TPA: hypothetical protein VN894_10210 [Polyangiaceae bacterium]|nr:hypothetical protein [Polyangiaceae bacterium]
MTRSETRRGLLLAVGLVACRSEAKVGATPPPDAALRVSTSDAAAGASGRVLAARCHTTERAVRLDDGPGLDDLDIGDGLAHAGGYAVGIVHRAAAGRVAAVALVNAAAAEARIVDLAPTLGDAPPPRLVSCRDQLVAAAFALPHAPTADGGGSSMARDLALYVVDSQGPEQPVIHIPQKSDESLAFDLACSGASGLAVWDETAAGGGEGGAAAARGMAARGVIRGASFQVGQRAAVPSDLSPPDSDAEMPRTVPSGAGFFVFWLARRADVTKASDGSADIEAIGEARAFGWLEMVVVDRAGQKVGPVRRLTPTSGHVSAYDALAHFDGPKPEVWVVARDDGESIDAAGGTLLRVRLQSEGGEPPVVLPTDGLGRGAPAFVDAPLPWLSWVGPHEEVRLMPLDTAGDAVAPPSAEEGLDEARPLVGLASGRDVPGPARGPSNQGPLLVAVPRDKVAQLRVFDCQR